MLVILSAIDSEDRSLDSFGYQPIFIVLLRTVLESFPDVVIYILVNDAFASYFCIEASRWFENNDNIMIAPYLPSSENPILLLARDRGLDTDTDILVLDSDYPLLSSSTLSRFIQDTSPEQTTLLCAKARARTSIISYRVLAQDDTVFAGAYRCPLRRVCEVFETGSFYYIPVYKALKECIPVRNTKDKSYAEHLHLENKHAAFLHQCYSMWKKINHIEDRITRLEKMI
jgi:hypothetical protein